ncbi:MAG: alpha/beta hydrolase, partial [Alphaproteobacteria bacterium]
MKFDPEVEAMFAKSAAQSSLDTSSTTLADSRRGYVEQSAMTGGPVIEMAQITDLTADGLGGTIPLRLYRP